MDVAATAAGAEMRSAQLNDLAPDVLG